MLTFDLVIMWLLMGFVMLAVCRVDYVWVYLTVYVCFSIAVVVDFLCICLN